MRNGLNQNGDAVEMNRFNGGMMEMEDHSQEHVPLTSSRATDPSRNQLTLSPMGKGLAVLFLGVFIGSIITSDMTSSIRFGGSEGKITPSPPPLTPGTPNDISTPSLPPTPPEPKITPSMTPFPVPQSSTPPPVPVATTPNPTQAKEASQSHETKPTTSSNRAKPQTVRPEVPLTSEQSDELAKEWGKWEFVDPRAAERPASDFYDQYPHRDVPLDKFPDKAWQTDPEYLKDWLDEGLKLTERAMEAILAEYGFGKKDMPDKSFEERDKTFELQYLEFESDKPPRRHGLADNGGFTTEQSFRGLRRRLLHALMTEDTFTFVVGGHSAAAAHGNHFQQSYAMQFHKVMEPVFALLGVKLRTHNFSQGGIGTEQASLGMSSIYGSEIDMIIWDSGMTENDGRAQDLFVRQALIGGNRAPFIFGGKWGYEKWVYMHADADVGQFGTGMLLIPETEDEVQAETLPYAARFLKCSNERKDLCNTNKYLATCWVERPDVTPPTPQSDTVGSQVGWHPGNRWHQIVGRSIAFTVLRALKSGIEKWQATNNFALQDAAWHVEAYYENIQSKVKTIPDLSCEEGFQKDLGTRICKTPMRGRTQFTPRANPDETSIESIIKPNDLGKISRSSDEMVYEGPNVHIPLFDLPEGAVDVLAIVSNGRVYDDNAISSDSKGKARRLIGEEMAVPGLGWAEEDGRTGYCDGSYNSECGRDPTNDCLLIGQNDGRGRLTFDSYSGWLVMTLPAVTEGLIMTKIETWHPAGSNPATQGWTSIDNKGRRGLRVAPDFHNQTATRNLKTSPPETCDDFKFDFSIDGKITTWNKDDWETKNIATQRVMEVQVLLDDPNFTSETKDVEVAIRMRGCGDSTKKTMGLTHIYWA